MRLPHNLVRRHRPAPPPPAFTVIIAPHSGEQCRNLRIPTVLLRLGALCTVLAALSLAWLGYDYLRLRSATAEINALRSVNREQARQLEALAARAADVEERLNELNTLDSQVREMLDLPRGPEGAVQPAKSAPRGGASRGVHPADIDAVLGSAAGALEPTRARLADLKARVAQYRQRLEHVPNAWPVRGSVTSRFGLRRSPFGPGVEFHEGLDIAAPYGAPVRATGAGRVVFAGWKSGYGRFVIIDHGYGYQTAYGHNSKLNVRAGQTVKRGEVIAYVGNTGRSTGPHVHYEVLYQGRKKDPLDFLL